MFEAPLRQGLKMMFRGTHREGQKHGVSVNSRFIYRNLGSPWGKTVNSYRRNHDIMGMLPIPPKAVEQGLAPPDLFPHKSSAKNPGPQQWGIAPEAYSYPQSSKIATMNSRPPCFMAMLSEMGNKGNGHTNH
jgi:hypothetical protein